MKVFRSLAILCLAFAAQTAAAATLIVHTPLTIAGLAGDRPGWGITLTGASEGALIVAARLVNDPSSGDVGDYDDSVLVGQTNVSAADPWTIAFPNYLLFNVTSTVLGATETGYIEVDYYGATGNPDNPEGIVTVTGEDLVTVVVADVPEPASMTLLACGAAVIAAMLRRRTR